MKAAAKKKKPAAKECDCFAQVQAELKQYNTKLRQDFFFDMKKMAATRSTRPLLVTEKIDTNKKKPPKKEVFAAYCPFCGKKYPTT